MSSEFVVRHARTSDRRSALRFVLSNMRRYPWTIVWLTIGAGVNAVGATLLFYYISVAYDALTQLETLGAVAVLAIVAQQAWWIIASQGGRAVLQLVRNFCSELYGQRLERDVRDELYANLLGKSMGFHARVPVGEIMARVTNDVRELNLMMNPGLNLIIGSGMFLLMPLFFSPLLHPSLLLTPVLFAVSYVWAQWRFVRRLHPVAQAVRASFGRMNARLAETLDGIEIVKGAAQEDAEVGRFDAEADEVLRHQVRQGDIEAVYLPLLFWGLAMVLGFAHVLYLAVNGVVDDSAVVAYMGYLTMFQFPVNTSLTAFSQMALGFASAQRILQVLNEETHVDQNAAGHDAPVQGAITFENVSFSYVPGQEVLHGVTFRVQPGQTVAVVGQTGAGKTTLTKLINRTYDVDAGAVRVDGVDVRAWNLAALRRHISIIEQDIFLFSRTIAENIAFGNPNATQEQIEAAARNAQAHEFITSFPEGYQTVIGQRGVTLSGGQRQRLAIARAFLTDPEILVLDDSTSAIDSATEDKIQRAIWTAAQGRTTILITHRLSQIRWADHIIVLKNGRIAAQGKHEDLLQSSEAYRRIFARYEAPAAAEPAPKRAAGD